MTTATDQGAVTDHGDFKYTFRQYLLMRGLNRGGDWTDVCARVAEQLQSRPDWDPDELDTYDAHERTYWKRDT